MPTQGSEYTGVEDLFWLEENLIDIIDQSTEHSVTTWKTHRSYFLHFHTNFIVL
jgi:hypothetical protein